VVAERGSESQPTPDLSVVVSTLGNYSGLARVLETYERQEARGASFEVIVVSDVAEPDAAAVDAAVGERPYPLRRATGTIPGLSSNRNSGVRAAAASLILFTDNDCLASPQLVSEHLDWHRSHPAEAVAVLGHVRWAREVKVTPFMHWLDHGVQFDYPNIKGTDAGWGRFYGANVSVKKSFVERVGGFDEVRMPYLNDDLDFGYRANEHGLRLLYNRRAEVEHLREISLEYWRQRLGRAAAVERQFTRLHPDVPPHFHRFYTRATELPPARGLGRHLIRYVPRRVPWLGPRVWRSADLYYRQLLAPTFLEAWDSGELGESGEGPVAPYLLEAEAVPGREGRA
jgi:GT2 family glycosyltransferase